MSNVVVIRQLARVLVVDIIKRITTINKRDRILFVPVQERIIK